jgi:hypothetical protein
MNEIEVLEDWLRYKLDCSSSCLDKPFEAEHEIDYEIDGHECHGQLRLKAVPSQKFEFWIQCSLPQDQAEELRKLILAGVLDELVSNELMPLLGCAIHVKEAKWLPHKSAKLMYYYCARECIKKIVASGENKAFIPGTSIT